MAKYRDSLPQLGDAWFMTDGGLQTTFIFQYGIQVPCFASFALLETQKGRASLKRYFATYTDIAQAYRRGLVLESLTWRASRDWGRKLGYGPQALAGANRRSVEFLLDIRARAEDGGAPIVISGCIGPRGDGYDPSALMNDAEAEAYHAEQIGILAETDADMISALTMTHSGEAIGIARAAQSAGMPAAISFTVETDGRLPSGEALGAAINAVDEATGGAPAYYMINCAHPSHFEGVLDAGGPWIGRLRGIRANASRRSHAELDGAAELDDGNPAELGHELSELRNRLPRLSVLGGCCGTDHRHIEEICKACAS